MVVNGTQVEHEIQQPPTDVFAVDEFGAGSNLDVGKPAQPEHAETQQVRKKFWPQIGKTIDEFAGVVWMKIVRQAHVENQQRHGDAEDSITEGVETRFCKHGGAYSAIFGGGHLGDADSPERGSMLKRQGTRFAAQHD
jgi:hypothetical protein